MITKLKDKGIKIEFFIALTGAIAERGQSLLVLKWQFNLSVIIQSVLLNVLFLHTKRLPPHEKGE